MKRNVINIVTILVVVFFVGVFGYLSGATADEALIGKETCETKVVTEIDNAFWITDEVTKVMNK